MPAWHEQKNRCIVPCQCAEQYVWVRASLVATLGELFWDLGGAYTAEAIYAFYRTCRLVVLKRHKTSASRQWAPGSASAARASGVAGVTGSALQAANIRGIEARTNKEALVEEYIQAVGMSADDAVARGQQQLFDEVRAATNA